MSEAGDRTAIPAKLYMDDPDVSRQMPGGRIGLELETQRIDRSGHLALTPNPFEDEPFIDRDFGEAQVEINTPPASGTEEAEALLHGQLQIVQTKLAERGELLWPFSGPPAIRDDSEIRIAEYTGELQKKTVYRRYLAAKYGKRKMTLCGIHFNYSFPEEVIRKSYEDSGWTDFRTYRDQLYLQLAEKVLAYSWVPVALLSASPLVDSSYFPVRREGNTVFTGYSSLRCSSEGYWNMFDPILSYEDIFSYAESIRTYRDKGLLRHEGELYYPVRIKPAGTYSLVGLRKDGVNHIELRMIDLNPLTLNGVDQKDLRFLQLFLIWLASQDRPPLDAAGQRRAIRNQKAAARYDWSEVKIHAEDEREIPLQQALVEVLEDMTELFCEKGSKWQDALQHQTEKIRCPEARPARQVRELYGDAYLAKGLKRAEELQEMLHV